MGRVWEAVLHGPGGLRQAVALKLLADSDPRNRDALIREARLGALITHRNVVVVYDFGEVDGELYVAMELVRGISLGRLVRRGPLPPAAVVDVGRQVCAGLEAIHALGAAPLRTWGNAEDTWGNTWEDDSEGLAIPGGLVVHRDIKPDNLLVDCDGVVRVADLGLARAVRTAGPRGGTRGYMPPEQAHGLEDTRADIFALGATLAELATGRRLLPSADDARLIEALDGIDLCGLDRTVPGLADIVACSLHLDPDERWPSAAAMSAALGTLRPEPEPTLRAWVQPLVPPAPKRPGPSEHGNLPEPSDTFVGRRVELDDVARHLSRPGITTISGPAGMGKSRLALEAVRGAASQGGRWLVDLSPTRSRDGMCHAVARALDLPLGGEAPVPQLGHALAAKGDAVLLLDGIDAVLGPVAEAVDAWRRLAPQMRIICTGRGAVGVAEEELLELGPLSRPDAVALLHARSEGHAFEGVEALVDALDRVPLAIEVIAAAGPGSITELHRHLATSDGVGAALGAAWATLTDAQRATLTQLTVFDGGFSLHAAEAVLALPAGSGWALDPIDKLVHAQLVQRDPIHRDRFRMLTLVEAWAGARLDPADRAAAEERHTRFFAQYGADEAVISRDPSRFAPDLDNLIAAWRRSRRPARNAALAIAVGQLLRYVGPAMRGEGIVSEALAVPDLTSSDTARLLRLRAELLRILGRPEPARTAWVESLTLSRTMADPQHEAASRLGLGSFFITRSRHADARPHLEAAVALVPTDDRLKARALTGLSSCARAEGHLAESRRQLLEARVLAARVGDRRTEALTHQLMGNLEALEGDLEAARRSYEAALHAYEESGDHESTATTLTNLGVLARRQGRTDEARQLYRGALTRLERLGARAWQGVVLQNLANLEAATDHRGAGHAYFRQALAIADETRDRRASAVIRGNLATLELEGGHPTAALRMLKELLPDLDALDELGLMGVMQGVVAQAFAELDRLDEARAWAARAHRLLETHGEPTNLCELLCRRGHIEWMAGDEVTARSYLDQAVELAARKQLGPRTPGGLAIQKLRSLLP